MAEGCEFKYRAFLSYSHRDKAWGKWLHGALEAYRIDRDLIGRPTPLGPVPNSLRPVFRDRDDFSAGPSLTAQTRAALAAAQCMIVLCSPRAATSHYVDQEIRHFKALGRADRVLALIVDGEPGDPVRECFPPALRFKVAADGTLTDEREEPIAADVRAQGDGKELAKQKLVAGLLGLGLDEIVRRGELARRRQARIRNGIIGVMVALTIASAGGFAWARHELSRNEELLDRTLQRATGLVDRAVAMSEKFSVPRIVSMSLLENAEGMFRDMSELGRETAQMRYRKAWMLIQFARNYAVLGNTQARRERLHAAHLLMQDLATQRPDNLVFQADFAITYSELAELLADEGNLSEALASRRSAVAIEERLSKSDPQNLNLRRNLAVDHGALGRILFLQGNLEEAFQAYSTSFDMLWELTRTSPDNVAWQGDLWWIDILIGDLFAAQNDDVNLLQLRREALSIAEWMTEREPDRAQWQANLAISHQAIGDALSLQGDNEAALASYRAELAIWERLAKSEPDSTIWQRNLADAHHQLARPLVEEFKLDEALANFRESLGLLARLGKADPKNAAVQGQLMYAHEGIGHVLARQDKLEPALSSLDEGAAVAERLRQADPSNAEWETETASILIHSAIIRFLQGRLDASLAGFDRAQKMLERLTGSDRANVPLRVLLLNTILDRGDVLLAQGKRPEALGSYREAIEILKRDSKIGFDLIDFSNALAQVNEAKTKIEEKLERLTAEEAQSEREDLQRKFAILESIAGTLKGTIESARKFISVSVTEPQFDPLRRLDEARALALAYGNIGTVLVADGDLAGARDSFQRAFELRKLIGTAIPANGRLQAELAADRDAYCWTAGTIDSPQQAPLPECREALLLRPGPATGYVSRGAAHLKAAEYGGASVEFSWALRIDPKNAAAFYGRGLARQKAGHALEGDADIASARSIDPGIAAAFWRAGIS